MQPNYPDIPGYELQGVLGTGGFASVYLARHLLLDRLVALKVMDPGLAKDREFCERFVREARDTARLGDHPNIVTIHDVGRIDDVYYIAMQYLPGPNLQTLLEQGASCGPPLDIIARVACALAHAHSQGFVHRDIKPANILFDEANEAILSDFGIAKALGRETQLTAIGSIVGTARYMSPEQATRPDEIDHRSDLYSLGVVLYEMIAGAPPFPVNDPMALMLAHVRDPIPELPPPVASCQPLIDKLMAKRPENRFASAGELLDELSRYSSDLSGCPPDVPGAARADVPVPPELGPETGFEHTPEPVAARRSRGPLFAGAAALAAVLVGGYVTTDPRVIAFISPADDPTAAEAVTADVLAGADAPRELPLVDAASSTAFVSSAEPRGDAASPGARAGAGTRDPVDASLGVPVVTGLSIEPRVTAGPDANEQPVASVVEDASDYQTLSEAELQRLQRLLDVAELHELVGRISAPPGANAIEAYSLALSLDPGNAVARGALARLQEQ